MRRLVVLAIVVCSTFTAAAPSAWAQPPGRIEIDTPATSERWFVVADVNLSLFAGDGFTTEHAAPNSFVPTVNDIVSARYEFGRGLGGQLGGGVMATSRLGFGVTRSRLKFDDMPVETTSRRPRLYRNSAGVVYANGWFEDRWPSVTQRIELAYHLEVSGVLVRTRTLFVRVFGGPTHFDLSQGLVRQIDMADAYPREQTTFRDEGWGYHAGMDVAAYKSNTHNSMGLGFGGAIRYSHADVAGHNPLDPARGPYRYAAGGWQVSMGLRGRF